MLLNFKKMFSVLEEGGAFFFFYVVTGACGLHSLIE